MVLHYNSFKQKPYFKKGTGLTQYSTYKDKEDASITPEQIVNVTSEPQDK
jgi:hypothetical protein